MEWFTLTSAASNSGVPAGDCASAARDKDHRQTKCSSHCVRPCGLDRGVPQGLIGYANIIYFLDALYRPGGAWFGAGQLRWPAITQCQSANVSL
jgi:hypothetical protein